MAQFSKFLLSILFLVSFQASLLAQKNYFSDISESSFTPGGKRTIIPQKSRTLEANIAELRQFLWSLPAESSIMDRNSAPILSLPLPGGGFTRFHVWESSIMEPGLAAKFPEIRTFCGQGIDDPYATIRLDFNPYFGFHAQILTVNGSFYIDPYSRGDINHYMSYARDEYFRNVNFVCEVPSNNTAGRPGSINAGPCRGTQLYTYRLAVACTGQYAVAVGASNAASLHAAISTTVNRVVGVYEREISVRLVLIANNADIEFLDANTDPFTGNSSPSVLISESQSVITTTIGSANYDIGHTFSTGGGGLAGLGVVCSNANKARGVTGIPQPYGDSYDIDYVSHEMGHQFGGSHTFNSETGQCGGNRDDNHAYEVGSGTTMLSYASICNSDNLQPHSDPQFHAVSFDDISSFVNSGGFSCKVATATGNTLPVITSMNNNGANIPLSTPFVLTGAATDADNDALTYSWEEWDLGPATDWSGGNNNTSSPLFKARLPKTIGSRTFPDIYVILANYPVNPIASMGGLKGETLPTLGRTMKFRLTVRDNRAGGGGVVSGGSGCQSGFTSAFTVNAIDGTGPFTVTYPSATGISFPGNSSQTVTWNVAGTNAAPISTTDVKILLSIDGGLTFPTVLVASTPNDGTESVTIPNTPTITARIKVEAVGNIYFDISNNNFSIVAATSDFGFSNTTQANITCGATSGSISLGTTSTGGFATPINLTASGNPAGTTVTFSVNPVTPGSSTNVTLNNTGSLVPGTYNVNITGVAGTVTHSTTLTYVVVAGTGPTITGPDPAVQVCSGGNAIFTVTAPGATSYQWQVSSNGGGSFTNLTNVGVYSGVTTNTLTVTGATAGLNGYIFHLIATTACGSSTSVNSTLTVSNSLSITSQPQSATACAGTNQLFSVTANGSGLNYQWQLSTDNGATWSDIGGANANSYTVVGVTSGMDGYRYRVIVNGTCPGGPLTSSSATLTVSSATSITSQPIDVIACVGNNAAFTVTAVGSSLTYQWALSTDGGGSFNNIGGATTNTLTLNSVTASMNGYQYHVTVTGCSGGGIVSNNVTLTVNSPVVVTTQPTSVNTCSNNATFTGVVTGTITSQVWQVSTDGGVSWINVTNGGVYAGATTPTLTITGATPGMSGFIYRLVSTGPCNPGGVNSSNATLTLSTPINITGQPANATHCITGTNTATFTVTATGSGITYQWQKSTDGGANWSNVAGATASSYTTPALTTAMNDNRFRVVLSNGCTSNLNSSPATLTVSQLSITAQPATTIQGCDQGATNISVTATGTGTITYQWQVSTDGGSNWTNATGGNSASLALTNLTSGMDGNLYRVIISNGSICSPVTSASGELTVNPIPNVTGSAAPAGDVCKGSSITLTGSGTAGATYTWDNGATNAAPYTINDNTTFTVTGTLAGCSNTDQVTVNVIDLPEISIDGPAIRRITASMTATLNTTTNATTPTYEWFKNNTSITGQTGASYDVTHSNLGTYTVMVTDGATGCSNTSAAVVVEDSVLNFAFISPNPNRGHFLIRYASQNTNTVNRTVTIYDSKGSRIYSKQFVATGPANEIEVDLKSPPAGTYMVELRDANGTRLATGQIIIL